VYPSASAFAAKARYVLFAMDSPVNAALRLSLELIIISFNVSQPDYVFPHISD
jgi:hypothetical protein